MAGLIDEFISLLQEQTEEFSDLAALAGEKKEAIINNDLEHLQKITSLENTLVGKNQKIERRRIQLMNDIATVLNVKAQTLTLSRLSELLKGQPGHESLAAAADKLRTQADELKRLNEQNRILIDNSLEYIDFSMNLVRSAGVNPAFYSSNGEELSGGNTFFDAKQ